MKLLPFRCSVLILALFVLGGMCVEQGLHAAEPLATDAVFGYWLTTEHEGVIELYPCKEANHQICGRFHWLQDDAAEHVARDAENPDPRLRNRPMCGMQFMGGFQPAAHGHYEEGWIYNPSNGATYSAHLTLIDGETLDLHGYLFTPLLGESRIWTRTTAEPVCKTKDM